MSQPNYLLKPSEIGELALKTDILERQQQELIEDSRRRKTEQIIVLSCIGIYLVAFAVMMLVHQIAWEVDFLWSIFPGYTLPIIVLLVATATVIFVCLRYARILHNVK